MDPASIASLLVAIVAALSAYASQRAASRASVVNTTTTVRESMEREAYERARKYDTDTITRQDLELKEILEENKTLKMQVRELLERVGILEAKVRYYEQETT